MVKVETVGRAVGVWGGDAAAAREDLEVYVWRGDKCGSDGCVGTFVVGPSGNRERPPSKPRFGF
jgi:hypothetical protein